MEEFYRKNHSGRKLQWHHLMSNGVVSIWIFFVVLFLQQTISRNVKLILGQSKTVESRPFKWLGMQLLSNVTYFVLTWWWLVEFGGAPAFKRCSACSLNYFKLVHAFLWSKCTYNLMQLHQISKMLGWQNNHSDHLSRDIRIGNSWENRLGLSIKR